MALYVAQLNLVLQIVILIMLSLGMYSLKKKNNFFWHGSMMTVAVVLNFLSFLLVMGPSFVSMRTAIADYPSEAISMVNVVHAGFGTASEVLGVWVVISWRLRSTAESCVGKKKVMQLTMVLWLVALFSGFLLYALLYLF